MVYKEEFSQNVKASFIDVASVKNKPVLDIEALGLSRTRFLPSHPMAGREIGGAESARSDLFIESISRYLRPMHLNFKLI